VEKAKLLVMVDDNSRNYAEILTSRVAIDIIQIAGVAPACGPGDDHLGTTTTTTTHHQLLETPSTTVHLYLALLALLPAATFTALRDAEDEDEEESQGEGQGEGELDSEDSDVITLDDEDK